MKSLLCSVSQDIRMRTSTRRSRPSLMQSLLIKATTSPLTCRDIRQISNPFCRKLLSRLRRNGWITRQAGLQNLPCWRNGNLMNSTVKILVLPNKDFPFTRSEREFVLLMETLRRQFFMNSFLHRHHSRIPVDPWVDANTTRRVIKYVYGSIDAEHQATFLANRAHQLLIFPLYPKDTTLFL